MVVVVYWGIVWLPVVLFRSHRQKGTGAGLRFRRAVIIVIISTSSVLFVPFSFSLPFFFTYIEKPNLSTSQFWQRDVSFQVAPSAAVRGGDGERSLVDIGHGMHREAGQEVETLNTI